MRTIPNLIIGGGLAGLAIGNQLYKRNAPFILLEAANRLGGRIESQLTPEACFEFGPNSFSNKSTAIFELIDDLGLREALLTPSPAAKKRYILKHGRLVRLPSAPPELLTTQALSWCGKLRFFWEFFHVAPPAANESVEAFFTRHFGAEIARYFADPFVSGIFAGDPKRLSIRDAFPKMAAAEDRASSILRYLIKEKKQDAVAPQSYELKGGLQRMFERASEIWGSTIVRTDEPVHKIDRGDPIKNLPHSPSGGAYAIRPYEEGGLVVHTSKTDYHCERLFITVPAYDAAPLLAPLSAPLGNALAAIEYPPVVTAHLRIPKTEAYPFDGFGLLIPSSEDRRILGTLWNSSTFPELFGDPHHHYITVYCGGTRGRSLLTQDDTAVAQIIVDEVHSLFHLAAAPTLLHFKRHPTAIPQYTLDYGNLKRIIHEEAAKLPGLYLAGNYLGGISMPDTVQTAAALAHANLQPIESKGPP